MVSQEVSFNWPPVSLTSVDGSYFGYHLCIKKDESILLCLIMMPKTHQESYSSGKSTTTMNKDFTGKTVSVEALKSDFP